MTSWPDIPFERWKETGGAVHMWAQIVGKARLARMPWVNHSWHATLYVCARGLTTAPIHDADQSYEVIFDFARHRLSVETTRGREGGFPLEDMSVANFHDKFTDVLDGLGLRTEFHHAPNEVADPIPFKDQTTVIAYNADAAHDYWKALLAMDRVFNLFRTRFTGKVSPVHLFWGSFDLAVTRFSGRAAPQHPGGIPALPDRVTHEAYSHEVSSAGFWPGGNGIDYPAFYSYAYPTPQGFGDASVGPSDAFFHEGLGEFILPYDRVRTASDPESHLLEFLQSTYEAAANLGNWDRAALETDLSEFGPAK